MTRLQAVRTKWRVATPASERAPTGLPVPRRTPRVPLEYQPLHNYLEHRYASIVVLTFEQMDTLLGFALPAAARTGREWWAAEVGRSSYSDMWTDAGWSATPNLPARTVTFERLP